MLSELSNTDITRRKNSKSDFRPQMKERAQVCILPVRSFTELADPNPLGNVGCTVKRYWRPKRNSVTR